MTDTEHLILKNLETIGKSVDQIGTRMDQLDSRMDQLDSRMDRLDSRMDQLDSRMDQLDGRMDRLDDKIENTNLLIENEISRKINIIGEGHDFLKMRLDEALQMEKKRERMELELISLRMDVKRIEARLAMA